ncbi:hypothetical protein [Acidisphaera sp. L21]|uniref:hypothetical protein n=1 Tax=Acidisphaera sp. L21 TaxID=1641851 RepID=UPI00131A92DD|nr:hypothetical protein [Acidisphaera sp. L21]
MSRPLVFALLLAATMSPDAAWAQTSIPTIAQISALGPEGEALSHRAGRWNVTESVWDHLGANPVVSTAWVAERHMVGMFLQETLLAAGDAAAAPNRIDYLGFDRVEGRWDYLSLDVRAPVGLMPAWSFDRGEPNRIVLSFLPFAVAGGGPAVTGQMLRMQEVVTRDGPDHETKDQLFILADGTGTPWLAHRYDYVRQH